METPINRMQILENMTITHTNFNWNTHTHTFFNYTTAMEFERSNFWNVVYCKRAQNSVHFTESMHKTSCLRRATRLLNADSVSFFFLCRHIWKCKRPLFSSFLWKKHFWFKLFTQIWTVSLLLYWMEKVKNKNGPTLFLWIYTVHCTDIKSVKKSSNIFHE